MSRTRATILLASLAVVGGLCINWATSQQRRGGGVGAPLGEALAGLSSTDPAKRGEAVAALVRIGPAALPRLCPFIRAHLADAEETTWRAAHRAEQEIARRWADDPHLDDYYAGLTPVKLPRRSFAVPGRPGDPAAAGGATIEFVKVPAGTFIQGCDRPGVGMPMAGAAAFSYAPVRKVTISRPFWIMRDEVTQRQFQAVMGCNPSRRKAPHRPVESVTYPQAVAFCRRLSKLFAPERFALPTEAQWEYACRAGTTGRHAYGNRPLSKGAVTFGLDGRTGENLFGLVHVHDGVFEWCRDWFAECSPAAATDPPGPPDGQYRAVRSNYEYCSAPDVNAAHRIGWPPEIIHAGIGLRVIRKAR